MLNSFTAISKATTMRKSQQKEKKKKQENTLQN